MADFFKNFKNEVDLIVGSITIARQLLVDNGKSMLLI